MLASDLIASFWTDLIGGRAGLVALFYREPVLDDPRVGHVAGSADVADYVADAGDWLRRQHARWSPLATTAAPERLVQEGVLHLQVTAARAVDLPVALAGDLRDGKFTWLRIYYSQWPLLNRHAVRTPLLPARHDLSLPAVVAAYQDALARGDLESILKTFGPEGYAREPSGGPYVFRGTEGLRHFYGVAFAEPGGIGLEHCSMTDDGVRCAIEYNAMRWGQTRLPPQAGIAVYERGSDERLAAARIYDDVEPPPAATTGP